MTTAIAVPLFLLLPGHLCLRLLERRSSSFAEASPTGAEAVVYRIVLSLTLTSWMAVILAELGALGVKTLAASLGLPCVAFWILARGRARGGPRGAAEQATAPPLLVLVIAALALSTPPYESTFWASDSTAYLNLGNRIADTGSLVFEDPLLREMSLEARIELFTNRTDRSTTGEFARFPGGFPIPEIEGDQVSGGFSPLFPVWIALSIQLFGESGAVFVAPFFALLGVVALYFLGNSLSGVHVGFLAASLLALSMPQIWFSRLPMAEVLSQCFLLFGLLALLRCLDTSHATFSIFAGAALGVSAFAKFDALPVVAISAVAWLAHVAIRGRRLSGSLPGVAVLGVVLVHATLHYTLFPSNYRGFVGARFTLLSETIQSIGVGVAALATLALVSSAWLAAVLAGRRSRAGRVGPRHVSAALLIALLLAYVGAYVVTNRPRILETVSWLGWYLSWPVLISSAVAVASAALLRARKGKDKTLLVLLFFLVAAGHNLYNPQEQEFGQHIWTMRRFVPVVLPLLMLLLVVGVDALFAGSRRQPRRGFVVAVCLLFALGVSRPSLAILGERPWRAGLAASADVAAMFPEDAVLLVGYELAGTHLQTTMSYLRGRDAVLLQEPYPNSRVLQEQVLAWLRRGREVFFLFALADTHFYAPRLRLSEARTLRLRVPVLESTVARVPRRMVVNELEISVFQAHAELPASRSAIDIGRHAADALVRLEGFHAPEGPVAALQDASYRWTSARVSMRLQRSEPITLILAGGRPAGVPPAKISIRMGDRLLIDDRELPDAVAEITLQDPRPGNHDAVDIEIRSTTFNPAALGLSDDDRDLGVRVYRVELGWRPASQASPGLGSGASR